MSNNRLLITTFCVSLMIFVQSEPTHACMFHSVGYGNSPWSSFESRSGRMPGDSAQALQTNNESTLKLSIPAMVRAKVKTEKALTVNYIYTSEDEEPTIQLSVDISPGITVADNKINLTGKSGQHTFILQPETSGVYRLMVTARDLNNKDIPSLHKTVYVSIYE